MTEQQVPADAEDVIRPTDEEDDTEGHSMFLNPSTSADMARARSKEAERQAREHARQKEARAKNK